MKFFRAVLVSFVFLFWWWWMALPVQATAACTASVSPNTLPANTSSTLNFSLLNMGDEAITYVELYTPGSGFTLVNYGVSGWSVETSPTWAGLYNNTVGVGETFAFSFGVNTGDEQPAADWSVAVYTNSGYAECSGGFLSVAISGTVDSESPVLSDVMVANVTGSSAVISWNTNEPAKGYLRYGNAFQVYEATLEQLELTTSKSFTLTGLSANTTYYFEYRAEDEVGNSTQWWDFYTFTTGSETTVIETREIRIELPVVQQRTQVQEKVITVLVRDMESPKVWFTSEEKSFYGEHPVVRGMASDNTMIVSVDYSIDGGKTWRPVSIEGRRKSESFSVELPLVEEGDYSVKLRAFDAEGNRGISATRTMVIDRFPPVIGGVQFLWGSQLVRSLQGKIVTALGVPMKIITRAAGGTTQLKLVGGTEELALSKDESTGRWTQTVTFSSAGNHQLRLEAVDGFNRTTETVIADVEVIKTGNIQSSDGEAVPAWITVYAKKLLTGRFEKWDGRAYQIDNPLFIDQKQAAAVALPAGTYYLDISADGYASKKTAIIYLDKPGLITTSAALRPMKSWRILGKQFRLPQLSSRLAPLEQVVMDEEVVDQFEQNRGDFMPTVSLLSETAGIVQPSEWLGETVVLAVESLWKPSVSHTVDYLQRINEAFSGITTVWVAPLSRLETLQGMRARAGSGVDLIISDEAGELLSAFQTHELPFFVLIGPDGKIQQISHQAFSDQVLKEYINE